VRWPVLQLTVIFSHTTIRKIQIIIFICCITELRVFCILAFIVFKPSGEQDKLFLIPQRNSTPQKQQVQTENSRVFNYQLPKDLQKKGQEQMNSLFCVGLHMFPHLLDSFTIARSRLLIVFASNMQ
jgi:hypothetical protein